jgi:glutamate--cysteine ligase catalytic subunit
VSLNRYLAREKGSFKKYLANLTKQLLHLWEHYRERTDVEPLWGDEVSDICVKVPILDRLMKALKLEFTLIELDPTSSRASLLLAQEDFMKKWQNLIKSEKAQKS